MHSCHLGAKDALAQRDAPRSLATFTIKKCLQPESQSTPSIKPQIAALCFQSSHTNAAKREADLFSHGALRSLLTAGRLFSQLAPNLPLHRARDCLCGTAWHPSAFRSLLGPAHSKGCAYYPSLPHQRHLCLSQPEPEAKIQPKQRQIACQMSAVVQKQ